MPDVTKIQGYDGTHVFTVIGGNGQVMQMSLVQYEGWLGANPGATASDFETFLLSEAHATWPTSTDQFFVHCYALGPPPVLGTLVANQGVAVDPNWWNPPVLKP